MQNQDPTAQTDPNEYINQLVQVNSLEQLIDINQNLTTALGGAGSTSGSSTNSAQGAAGAPGASQTGASPSSPAARGPAGAGAAHTSLPGVAAAHKGRAMTAAHSGGSGAAAAINKFAQSASAKHAPGNLSVPKTDPAAHRVAHALDGHSHAPSIPGKLPGA
jgi:flagellar basal-body rod modification protein FlgD